jgi:hypothetical protein
VGLEEKAHIRMKLEALPIKPLSYVVLNIAG